MAVSFSSFADKLDDGKRMGCLNVPKGLEIYRPKTAETIRVVILPYVTTQCKFVDPGELFCMAVYYQWNGLGENKKGSCVDVDRTYGKKCPIRNELQNFSGPDKDKPRSQKKVLMNLWFPDTNEVKLLDFSYASLAEPLFKDIKIKAAKPKWAFVDQFYDPENPVVIEITFEEDTFNGNKFIKAAGFDYEEHDGPIPQSILDKAADLDLVPIVMSYDEMVAKFIDGTGEDEEVETETEEAPVKKVSKPAPKDDEPEEKPAPKAKAKTEKPSIESLAVGSIMFYHGDKVEVVSAKDGVVKVKDADGDILKVKESDLTKANLEEPPKKAKTSKAAKQEAPADDDGDEPWDKWVKDDE